MLKEEVVQIFDVMGGDAYDKSNSLFSPVQQNLHFLIKILLKDLPQKARVLCVGVGTGADLIDLAKENPEWTFVGIDPAASMLEKCQEKLKAEGLSERCELFHGFLADYQNEESFDATLCLFVMHFIKDMNERAQMYRDIAKHLNPNGYYVEASISVDTKSDEYAGLLTNWKNMHGLAGAPKEKLDNLKEVIEKQLAVLTPQETKSLISKNGFLGPIQFFQSFLITGYWAKKSS